MTELYINSSDFVYLNITQAGSPQDADSLPTVTVTADGVDLGVHSVAHESTGVYKTLITLADTSVERILKVKWTFALASVTSSKTDTYTVVTPLMSLADVAAKAPVGTTDDNLRFAEQYARYMIQSVTNQEFGKKSLTVEAYGQNADVLLMPKRILEVHKLYQNGVLVIDVDAMTNTFNFPVEITDTNYAIRLIFDAFPIQQWSEGGVFNAPGKFQTSYRYKVNGLFGWDSVPGEIKMAAIMLVNDFFCKDSAWRNKYIEDMSSADWSITFNEAVWSGTGNFAVDNILGDYIWNSMVVI